MRRAARTLALRRTAAKEEEHDSRVARWYGEITGAGARAVARRIASHETEYFVRRMVHEAGGGIRVVRRGGGEAPRRARGAGDRSRPVAGRARSDGRALRLLEARPRHRAGEREGGGAGASRGEARAIVLDEVALLAARFPEKAERLAVDTSAVDASLGMDDVSLERAFVPFVSVKKGGTGS